jgi:molybdopterin-guanine dinucleotide biosynthesis protein A
MRFVGLNTAGVALAGGKSTRMGFDKAFAPLAGRPLVNHVAARLQPQVDALFVNANGDPTRFAGIGCAVVADAGPRPDVGPLAGIAAALDYAQRLGVEWLATAPCDAPFLPLDLVARLAAAAEQRRARLAVAASANGLEPMFALWSTALAREVDAALAKGEGSPRGLFARLGAAEARFDDAEAFANLNTPADFAAAVARLR